MRAEEIKLNQAALACYGLYDGKIDGDAGGRTKAAAEEFTGGVYPPLVVGGVFGIKSCEVIFTAEPKKAKPKKKKKAAGPIWQGEQNKLTDYDIPRIGHSIGVGEDEIHMVLSVESLGKGYKKYGVILLFEEHVFYRRLPKHLRQAAVSKGLAHPKWRRNYKNNYERFLKAYELHPRAALLSCSWGLGQIMGFNHEMVGYETVEEMVIAFAESEANQLAAVVEFIKSSNLDDELRDMAKTTDRRELVRLARTFARVYNGSGYAKNNYHNRLVDSLNWWRRKPNIIWHPGMAEEEAREYAIAA